MGETHLEAAGGLAYIAFQYPQADRDG